MCVYATTKRRFVSHPKSLKILCVFPPSICKQENIRVVIFSKKISQIDPINTDFVVKKRERAFRRARRRSAYLSYRPQYKLFKAL